MQLTKIAETVMKKRYLRWKEDGAQETPDEMLRRVARVVAQVDAQYGATPEEVAAKEEAFYNLIDSQDFMPNSPTFTGAGTELGQLSACFVLPIGDSLPEIYETMKQAALIHQRGGGTGFAFSRLRPAGDKVKTSQGVASGPISFLRNYNASTEAIKQGGTRRGANMAVLRVDHPDVMEFIEIKTDLSQLQNFNLSVGITEKFMEAVRADGEYDLVNPRNGEVVKRMRAREVWDRLIDCAWKTGEPGIVFLDRMNRLNPNSNGRVPVYVAPDGTAYDDLGEIVKELIESTNPCGKLLAA